jgi:uncharacterized membrane protein
MDSPYRERRFVWAAAYFVVVGYVVIHVFAALDSLGAALSAESVPPRGLARTALEVAPYCVIGAMAGCIRNVKLRAALMMVAQITFVATIAASSRTFHNGLVAGLVLCGALLVPFGWVWFVLSMDLFLKPQPGYRGAQ